MEQAIKISVLTTWIAGIVAAFYGNYLIPAIFFAYLSGYGLGAVLFD